MTADSATKHQQIQVIEDGLRAAFRRLALPHRAVLLAVSGGADSMTLLSGAARIAGRVGLQLEVATIDHQLRAESAAEVGLVERAAAALGLTHHVRRAPVTGSGLEAAAREARYAALEAIRRERGLDAIATAHTANDQAETVLMRLTRGAALSGAAAIQEARSDAIVRPLLFATRAEVEAYVAALGLQVARDPMNSDPQFLRVRLRQSVVPALVDAAGISAVRALARFAALAAEDEAELSSHADTALRRAVWPDGSLDTTALSALTRPIARRVLARWLASHDVEVDAELIDAGLRAARARSVTTLPGDRLLSCADGRARVVAAPPRLHATS